MKKFHPRRLVLLFLIFGSLLSLPAMSQTNQQMHRIAKIKVDPNQLEKYTAALKEQMTAAIQIEPGVLSYHAVADKKDPTNITIFEVYESLEAYQSHILTAHFKKYKETVKDMVLALELEDVNLVCTAKKPSF